MSKKESANLLRAYRFNQLEQSRLRTRLSTLQRDQTRSDRVNGYDIRKIASTLDFIKSSSGASPEGMPPGSAYRQMCDSTKTMYGDHMILQRGSHGQPRPQSVMPEKRASTSHGGRRRVGARATTAGGDMIPRRTQSSSGRPSAGTFSSAWIRQDVADSESVSDLSTISDFDSEMSGATENNKQTTAGAPTVVLEDRATSRQERPPVPRRDFLRKGGKSIEAQMAQSDSRRKAAVRINLMEINEDRRKALNQRLRSFWKHYPVAEWHAH